jgi:peptide/nickel transport system permease protein
MLPRIAEVLIALWAIATIVFFLVRLGGDPAALMLPPGSSQADLAAFRHQMGFDQPIFVQYLSYLRAAATGDFGVSFDNGRPAFSIILERLPASLELAAAALLFGVVLGSLSGYVAATHRGGVLEFAAMSLSLLGQAMPKYWLGMLLVLFFSVQLGLLPTSGRTDGFRSLILPAVTLGTFVAATIARFLRGSMLKVLAEEYVRTAHAKGIAPRLVYRDHVVRNALIPMVTITGVLIGELVGNAVIIETIFAWSGVGRTIIQAIERKDFALVQAGVVVLAAVFIISNLVVDLLYTVLDPRIRVR